MCKRSISEERAKANRATSETVLAQAKAAGVDRLVCIGTGVATSAQAVALARGVASVGGGAVRAWASIGLHPHEASATAWMRWPRCWLVR